MHKRYAIIVLYLKFLHKDKIITSKISLEYCLLAGFRNSDDTYVAAIEKLRLMELNGAHM